MEARGAATHDVRTSAAERRTVRPGDVSVPSQLQNAELLGQQTAIAFVDGVFGPLIEVGVPDWAVIPGGCRASAKGVVRPIPAQVCPGQGLGLRIVAAALGSPLWGH